MKTKFKVGDIVVHKIWNTTFLVIEPPFHFCSINGYLYHGFELVSNSTEQHCIDDLNFRRATDKDIARMLSSQLRNDLTNNYWEEI